MKKILFLIFGLLISSNLWAISWSGGGSSFTPYGPGNPAPAPGITGVTCYYNADSLSGAYGSAVTYWADSLAGTSDALTCSASVTGPTLLTQSLSSDATTVLTPYGGHQGVYFDYMKDSQSTVGLNFSAGPTITLNNFGVFEVFTMTGNNAPSYDTFFQFQNVVTNTWGWDWNAALSGNNLAENNYVAGPGTTNQSTLLIPNLPYAPCLLGTSCGATYVRWYEDGNTSTVVYSMPASTASAYTVGDQWNFGNSASVAPLSGVEGYLVALIVINHEPTDDEYARLRSWAYTYFGCINNNQTASLATYGNSIPAGHDSSKSMAMMLAEKTGKTVYNMGYGGQTTAQELTAVPTALIPYIKSGKFNEIITNEVYNQIANVEGGDTTTAAALTYPLAQELNSQIRNAGAKVDWLAPTFTSANGYYLAVTYFNNLALNTTTGFQSTGCLDEYINGTNLPGFSYYTGQSIHPNVNGTRVICDAIGNSLIANKGPNPAMIRSFPYTLSSGQAAVTGYWGYGMIVPSPSSLTNDPLSTIIMSMGAGNTIINVSAVTVSGGVTGINTSDSFSGRGQVIESATPIP